MASQENKRARSDEPLLTVLRYIEANPLLDDAQLLVLVIEIADRKDAYRP